MHGPIFVFENNGFGEGTGHDYAVGSKDIAGRAAGFGLPAVKVDGTDFFAVYEAAQTAIFNTRNSFFMLFPYPDKKIT